MRSATVSGNRLDGRRRKRRRDYGSVRFSERDGQLLQLIAEQYAISVDQLARLIGRRYRTGRWLRDRWRRAGWVESRQLLRDGPSLVWLTREGTRVARSPHRTWRPNPGMVAHITAVSEVRLLLDRELRLGVWHGERSLAKSWRARSEVRPHLPDAVLEREDGEVAIEVELTLKSRARLDAIVEQLALTYSEVWYFAVDALVPTLRQLAAESPWQNVVVFHYPPRRGELCA